MRRVIWLVMLATMAPAAERLKLVTLDPGHFHAALVQKEMLPELSDEAYVYAPLGPDLMAHLNRIAQFNGRSENPARWKLAVYAGPDYWEQMLADRRGQIVVLSGRNRGKIDRIEMIARRGWHALADKPWIIEPEDLPKLESALEAARQQGVVAYDGMTQRYEISCILQRELVNTPEVFGTPLTGSPEQPAVYMESIHYLLKRVAGQPNLRPPWFFDIREQGEGLTDVGTHLVDLAQWILFPDQVLDWRKEVRVLKGSRWPTVLKPEEFQRVTGERPFPDSLSDFVRSDGLHYYCNNRVDYAIRGVHARLDVKWGFEASPGAGDTELAMFSGSKSRLEVRQGREENYRPEVYVVPNRRNDQAQIAAALERKLEALRKEWPGLELEDQRERFRVRIPDALRIGHEAHFALLARKFLGYVKAPQSLPEWERAYMLAKYYVTTKGVELARQGYGHEPPRH